MVATSVIEASNKALATTLPPASISVFVGGTNGIGEYTLLALAKHAVRPKIYCVGRSEAAWTRIAAECKRLNPDGQYEFLQSDLSLIRNVDEMCAQLKKMLRGQHINFLVLSIGTLDFSSKTSEGFLMAEALTFLARIRIIQHLLPLLNAAPTTAKRILYIFTGTKEMLNPGNASMPLLQRWLSYINPAYFRGYRTSLVTLMLEEMHKRAPMISIVHDYPGYVQSGITRGASWYISAIFGAVLAIGKISSALKLAEVSAQESGERHLYLLTSPRYGVSGEGDMATESDFAIGSDGIRGSGVYTVDEECESGGANVVKVLQVLRAEKVGQTELSTLEAKCRNVTGMDVV